MMNPNRVFVVSANVFREVIRDRALYLVGLFAIAFVLVNVLVPEVAASEQNQIIPDLGLALISILGLLLAVFVGAGLINQEIEKRTVLVMLAKPVSHTEFILGKYLGLSAVLAVLVIVMNLLYVGILWVYQIPFPLGSTLLAGLYQFFELSLMTAVAIMFGVFTSSLLATLLTLATYFMGHFSQDLVALGQISEDPNIQRLTEFFYLVLPDLSRLNLKNDAVYGMTFLPSPVELAGNALYGLVYAVLLLAIAILVFSRRQF
jgi:ABC-type transport system involved in multi-copper enzyme maturation permease subunit